MYKVILVDDEYMILSGLKQLIQWTDLGLECVGTFADGSEALAYVKDHPVDIVITDVSMPIMTGIEFIAQAQAEDLNFNFIILSGYQEFDYVKEGIRLGAENFILKPIDAKELNYSLARTVRKLEDERQHHESAELLYETTLERWVNGDIDGVDLRRILKQFKIRLNLDGLYSCLLVGGVVLERIPIWQEMLHKQRIMTFYVQHERLVIIVEGSSITFDRIRKAILATLNEQERLAIGELFVTYEYVERSFAQAESLLDIMNFYGNQELTKDLSVKDIYGTEENISFEAFHQALSLNDANLIRQEIQTMLQQATDQSWNPEHIRYISYILFSDIYRQHFQVSSESYYSFLNQLNQAHSIQEIETLLLQAIGWNEERFELNQYNTNVQMTLQAIHKRYAEDISISSIAEELHVNAMYLGQIFKRETSHSFSQYLNKYRIKRAQSLLTRFSHNVNEIAEHVGYTSSGYFYKNFKKECGISPREYRKRYFHQQS